MDNIRFNFPYVLVMNKDKILLHHKRLCVCVCVCVCVRERERERERECNLDIECVTNGTPVALIRKKNELSFVCDESAIFYLRKLKIP